MGRKPKDITGQRFGRLVVVEDSGERQGGNVIWKCMCDCGNEMNTSGRNLTRGYTKSCGCYHMDLLRTGIGTAKARASEAYKEAMKKDLSEKGTRISSLSIGKTRTNNKSGTTGVWFEERRGVWKAAINLKGKRIFLGRFTSKQDAINARKEAEETYFKPILEKYGKSEVLK